MPRYFFHTADGMTQRDGEGVELIDDDAARIEATRTLGQMIDLSPEVLWPDGCLKITVTDETGRTLLVLDLTVVISR